MPPVKTRYPLGSAAVIVAKYSYGIACYTPGGSARHRRRSKNADVVAGEHAAKKGTFHEYDNVRTRCFSVDREYADDAVCTETVDDLPSSAKCIFNPTTIMS